MTPPPSKTVHEPARRACAGKHRYQTYTQPTSLEIPMRTCLALAWPGGLAPQGELVAARAAARPSGHERRRAGRPVSHPRAAARQARRSEARASGRVYTCWLSTLMCVPPKRYVNVTLTVFALSQPSQVLRTQQNKGTRDLFASFCMPLLLFTIF